MVSNKQRQRQLARAKWQRQRSRREARAKKTRHFQVVVGTILGLAAAAALVWVVVWIVDQDSQQTPDQVNPTNGERPSFISPPPETDATPTSPGQTGGTSEPGTTAPTRTGGTATSTQGTTR